MYTLPVGPPPNRHFLSFSACTGHKCFKLGRDIILSFRYFFKKLEAMNIGLLLNVLVLSNYKSGTCQRYFNSLSSSLALAVLATLQDSDLYFVDSSDDSAAILVVYICVFRVAHNA